jgi:hypothetical protein
MTQQRENETFTEWVSGYLVLYDDLFERNRQEMRKPPQKTSDNPVENVSRVA